MSQRAFQAVQGNHRRASGAGKSFVGCITEVVYPQGPFRRQVRDGFYFSGDVEFPVSVTCSSGNKISL